MTISYTVIPGSENLDKQSSVSLPKSQPLLTIIIPAYNEEKRLPSSLDQISTWMKTVSFSVEILVVENGSHDRTTEVAEAYAFLLPNLRVLHSAKGKGAAVREGFMHACGEYLFICDSDLSMPIAEVENFLPPRITHYDVVIASREAPGAIRHGEPYYRHLMGRIFNLMTRFLAVPGIQDTQCGFKLFKREAALDLVRFQTITGWTFDVELLFLALRKGYRVTEVPINWYFNPDSRIDPLPDAWQMLLDIVSIRLNELRGMYSQRPGSTSIMEQASVNE